MFLLIQTISNLVIEIMVLVILEIISDSNPLLIAINQDDYFTENLQSLIVSHPILTVTMCSSSFIIVTQEVLKTVEDN